MSRLSYTPSPRRPLDGDDSDHLKLQTSEKSVGMEKKPANKGITQSKSGEEHDNYISTVAKTNPGKQLNKVVNKGITEPKCDEECNNGKSKVAKPNPRKKGKKVGSEDGKQYLKSVKQKKKTAKKAVANGKNKEETEDSVVQGVKCVKGGKKGDTNHKPQIECDNNEVARSNISRQVSPEPEFLPFETPPTFQSSPKQQSVEFTEGNDPIQCLCPCPFECGTEPSEISLMKHHSMEKHSENCEHDKKDGDESTAIEEEKYSKLMRQNNFHEVVIPGNGFCFISALLITLAEQGLDKEMAVLAHDVMSEIRNHIRFYREFGDSSSKEDFLLLCSDFFQRGSYTLEVIDVCIGATANALGVNLNVIQKNQKTYSLTSYDCTRYKSSNNLFILFVPPSCKKGNNLDAHYNCYVNKEYFKQNEAAIKSQIVMPIEENQDHVAAPTSGDNVSQSSMENSKT